MSKERVVVLRTMAEVVAQMVAQGDWQDEALAAEASALAHRLNEEARAIEAPRTPETVLRAMLKTYEAAALAASTAYYAIPSGDPSESVLRDADLSADFAVGLVRDELASHLANGRTALLSGKILDDYEMRLSGARPLDAPPLEEP